MQAYGPHAGQVGDPVGPGARRVDHHGCLEVLARRAGHDEGPWAAPGGAALDGGDLMAQTDLRAARAGAAQEALVQGLDVGVHGAVLEHPAADILRPKRRDHLQHSLATERGDRPVRLGRDLRQGVGLVGPAEVEAAARRQQPIGGEAVRRTLEEAATGPRQPADDRIAVGLRVERRRAPGGVVAVRLLALEQQHPRAVRQFVGSPGAGDPGPDDEEIEGRHERLRGGGRTGEGRPIAQLAGAPPPKT